MAVTFQRAYKITLGQFNTSDSFNVLMEVTELRFSALVSITAKNSTVLTPDVSTVRIFNLSPEQIEKLTGADDLYIEIKAGYKYANGSFVPLDDLPIVYFGSVIFIEPKNNQLDLVTTFQCTPMHGKGSSAKANRIFTKGSPVKDVFDYLASTMNSTISHEWEARDVTFLKGTKSLSGSSTKLMEDWGERFNLRVCHGSSGIIKIIDKAVKDTGRALHEVPLTTSKGYPSVSVDVSKVLKEKTSNTPNVKLNTFLYPTIDINDTVRVELIDYTVPQIVGEYVTTTQDFIVNRILHKMDSHEGGSQSWNTSIEGKGAQK